MGLIHHAAILVSDLDRAERFYCELLRLTPTRRMVVEMAGVEQVFLSAGERFGDLVIARRLERQAPPRDKRELFHLAYELGPDRTFDAFLDEVAERGTKVVAGPMEHEVNADGSGSRRAVYLLDPDGHLVEVTQDG